MSSEFSLETAMAQSPMLQMIPYSSSFNLYRFPPTTPGLGLLIGSLFAADVLPGHQEEPLDPRTADADQLKRAGQGWLTITRTKEEVSIMLDADYPASDVGAKLDELVHARGSQGVKDGPFGCLRIRGPMELDLVGIASRMLAPLTRAAISVLVISSYDTDFVFIKREKMAQAQELLAADGWVVL